MRIDKYDPISGGFRAPLAADQAATSGAVGSGTAGIGVGIDVNGRVVAGAGQTGIKGVLVLTRAMKAGDIVDVMDGGEVVEFGGVAGTNYTADTTTGAIGTSAQSATKKRIGHTVEAGRLIVRVSAESAEVVE